MRVEVYLDGGAEPVAHISPPEKLVIDTTTMEDGSHELSIVATDSDGIKSYRKVDFVVQNGPSITVYGIKSGEHVSGNLPLIVNAYGSKTGDEFEPVRMETPAPIPTWSWVLFLVVLAWGAGYLSLDLTQRVNVGGLARQSTASSAEPVVSADTDHTNWKTLGEQVYGNNCASCHMPSGEGVPGVFPPLKGNSVVNIDDATEHVLAILKGVKNKEIDGVLYSTPMPGFSGLLSDEEVAAVANHERQNWGNTGKTITSDFVQSLRGQ